MFKKRSAAAGCLTHLGTDLLLTPAQDGVTHLNLYSEAKTEVGRKLSNFPKAPFVHPTYGAFISMEGYWHWCSTGKCKDLFREKFGFEAKKNKNTQVRVPNDRFEQDILEGLHCKLAQNPEIYKLLMESTLPFTHYYIFAGFIKDAGAASLFWLRELGAIRDGKPLMESAYVAGEDS